MKTQTILTIFTLMLFSGISAQAQQLENLAGKKEKIESYKVAYLTRQMNLSAEEAQKFWPVYNQHQNDKKAYELEKRKLILRMQQGDDFLELMEEHLKIEEQLIELKRAYIQKLVKVLPKEKVKDYYMAERDFRKRLLRMAARRRSANN